MTKPDQLLWNHAIENENFELAENIARHLSQVANNGVVEKPADVTSALKTTPGSSLDIIETYAYWGLDLPTLPIQGMP